AEFPPLGTEEAATAGRRGGLFLPVRCRPTRQHGGAPDWRRPAGAGIMAGLSASRQPRMSEHPRCPQCSLDNTYQDGALWVCADCGHEWNPEEAAAEAAVVVRDCNGNVLAA